MLFFVFLWNVSDIFLWMLLLIVVLVTKTQPLYYRLRVFNQEIAHQSWVEILERFASLFQRSKPLSFQDQANPVKDEKVANLLQQAGHPWGMTPIALRFLQLLLTIAAFLLLLSFILFSHAQAVWSYNASLSHIQQGASFSALGQLSGNASSAISSAIHQKGSISIQSLFGGTQHIQPPSWPSIFTWPWFVVGLLIVYQAPIWWLRRYAKRYQKAIDQAVLRAEQVAIPMLGRLTIPEIIQMLADIPDLLQDTWQEISVSMISSSVRNALSVQARRIPNKNFRLLCDVFIQSAVENSQYSLQYLTDHLRQIDQMHRDELEEQGQIGPLWNTMLTILPIGGAVALLFYPFLATSIQGIL